MKQWSLVFDNKFVQDLPVDPIIENYPRQVRGACFSWVTPQQVSMPSLLAYSKEAAELIDLSESHCQTSYFTEVFSGNTPLEGMQPYASSYGGHQFGNWAGQLGDGRAINLGEICNQKGQRWAVQLKGAGPTPYSRTADGLAVLRSSLREFLCSEAMYHLGVPTTRALSLITTGEQVMRDVMYSGDPQLEPGAVVCRLAPSFTRFGHIQYYAQQNEALLKQFVDHTLRVDFPHLGDPSPSVYLQLFEEVCLTSCTMVVNWMRVGFVHGVMNTDNMSILGLTIDYGPYGWLEAFDINWTPNTTDKDYKRYAYGEQGKITHWNLYQLANALYPLIKDAKPLEKLLDDYADNYASQWLLMMMEKLGCSSVITGSDSDLIQQLVDFFKLHETDMTIFFRRLADLPLDQETFDVAAAVKQLAPAFYPESFEGEAEALLISWLNNYAKRCRADVLMPVERKKRMNRVNPKFVLRNYLAQQAIEQSEQGDQRLLNELLDVLRKPYDEQPSKEHFNQKRPEWAKHKVGCSMLSCSS